MSFNIAIDVSVHPTAAELFSSLGHVTVHELTLPSPEADIMIIRSRTKADANFLRQMPKLKIIGTATSGTDHIDIEYAKKKGIRIFDSRGANSESVADYVFRMLLYATDDTAYTVALLKDTKGFEKIKTGNRRGELGSLSIGIAGLGAVGSAVKKRADAFGMKVYATDPYNKEAQNTLDEIIKCDIIVLCAPLTKETTNMISARHIAAMKPGALLINVSRAELLDEKALTKALQQQRIKAILDVFRNEPEASLFYELAICTPHIAGNSEEAKKRAVDKLYNEIRNIY